MDETHPQDRVQAAKEHLKGAADDLHSASKAKAAQFQNVAEDAVVRGPMSRRRGRPK